MKKANHRQQETSSRSQFPKQAAERKQARSGPLPEDKTPAKNFAFLMNHLGNRDLNQLIACQSSTEVTLDRGNGDGNLAAELTRARLSTAEPLPISLKGRLEQDLQADLTDVQIHSGPSAAKAASSLSALAFTIGKDIHFAAGRYQPDTREGQQLIAHEVTHTVQSQNLSSSNLNISDPASSPEKEARRFAQTFINQVGGPFPKVQAKVQSGIWRDNPPRGPGSASGEAAATILGPLPAGERRQSGELHIEQVDENDVLIRLGVSYVRILGITSPIERYAYAILPQEIETQRVVRITATPGISIDTWNADPTAVPYLVVHIRRVESFESVRETNDPFATNVVEMMMGNNRRLILDNSQIDIECEHSEARFAYSLDPAWGGPGGREKVVHIVATPGVRIHEIHNTFSQMSLPQEFALPTYNRVLVADIIRVQDPAGVPAHGEPIYPERFLGEQTYASVADILADPLHRQAIRVATGRQGVMIRESITGANLRLSARDPAVGAHFAYQIVTADQTESGRTEIRAVVGPGVFVEMVEPHAEALLSSDVPVPGLAPTGAFLEEGAVFAQQNVDLLLFEVADPSQVPPQGSPLDVSYLRSIGRQRPPDRHRYEITLEQTLAMAGADILVGLLPGVGDVSDISEFVVAMATGRDRWGRPVADWELALMGVGALLPFIGSSLLRGGSRAASEIASLSAVLGRSPEELEVMLARLNRLSPEDQELIERTRRALTQGDEVGAEDLERLQRLLSGLGGAFVLDLPLTVRGLGVSREAVTSQIEALRRTRAVSEEMLASMSGEQILALDVIRQGLPTEVFTEDLIRLLTHESAVRRNPLYAIFAAGITPDDIRALNLTSRAGAEHAYRILRGGRPGGAPGYHALIGRRLHDWQEFQEVVGSLSHQQAGAVFEHWIRRHVPWAGSIQRLQFNAADYGLRHTRTTDIWLDADGTIWEMKYYTGHIPAGQARDLASLVGQVAPNGTAVTGVRYIFPNREVAEMNRDLLNRLGIEVHFINSTGVMEIL